LNSGKSVTSIGPISPSLARNPCAARAQRVRCISRRSAPRS
jgi:hypothetical protein